MPKRPYTAEQGRAFCARLAEGESLAAVCGDPAMPGRADILDWLCCSADFRRRYARTRELQSHILLDEILVIADGNVQDPKQRIDTRKWVVDRLTPTNSSEKTAASKASKTGRPVVVRVVTGVPRAGKSGSSNEGDRSGIRSPRRLQEIPRED